MAADLTPTVHMKKLVLIDVALTLVQLKEPVELELCVKHKIIKPIVFVRQTTLATQRCIVRRISKTLNMNARQIVNVGQVKFVTTIIV